MIETELHTKDIPNIYRRFEQAIGAKYWRSRVRQCKSEMRGNALLSAHLKRENNVAFQLDRLGDMLDRYQWLPIQMVEDRALYPAVRFASQILSLIDASSRQEAERLKRRVHGAFRNPDDMRGLCLELAAATHFIRRGWKVSWPEADKTATFDLLVSDIGNGGLEVECKSISKDKGRRIHEREAIEFHSLLRPHLERLMAGLTKGISAVLTLPGRLSGAFKERQELAKEVGRAISVGADVTLPSGATIEIKHFDPQSLGFAPFQRNTSETRVILDALTETTNREAMIIASHAGGLITFVIQSVQDDNLIKMMFDVLSDAARKQLSGNRAGLLLASLEGIDSDQLRSLSYQDQSLLEPPTGLRVGVSRFLDSTDRKHLIGVGFLGADEFIEEGGSVRSGGTAYHFHRKESPYWSDDFNGLFTWSDNE
jgi:hypothetical protein